jgi:glycosyltransferase involved in cell wall biosynthesis
MSPKVSVILPVYNRSASLADSMLSVLNQSYRDLELIVVDDASTEDLKSIVDGIRDSRVRYIRQAKNGGASVARNAGLAAAKGEYIAFQDSDDLWLPGKLARQMEVLAGSPPDVGVVTGSKVLYGSGPDGSYGVGKVSMRPPPASILKPGEDQVRKYLVENRISLQNALFRKNCYPHPVWFDDVTRSNADWAFTAHLAQHTRIIESPDPVVMAFSSPDSISKLKKTKAIGLIRIVKRNRKVYEKYPPEHAAILWRIGRILGRAGKPRMARKFYIRALSLSPALALKLLRGKE